MSRKLLATKTFDYAGFDGELKSKLICLMGEINSAKGQHIKAAMMMGEAIQTANDLLSEHGKYGRFGEWVELECGIGRTTAHRYMAAWGRFQKCDALGQFDDTAMYALSAPSVPEAAAIEASKLASKGIRITAQRAKEIVDSYTPKREQPTPQKDSDCSTVEQSTAQPSGNSEVAEPPLDDEPVDFDPVELEAQTVRRNGKPVISRQDRVTAQKHLGGLIRSLELLGLYEKHSAALSAITEDVQRA
jgi:hypothetical protein